MVFNKYGQIAKETFDSRERDLKLDILDLIKPEAVKLYNSIKFDYQVLSATSDIARYYVYNQKRFWESGIIELWRLFFCQIQFSNTLGLTLADRKEAACQVIDQYDMATPLEDKDDVELFRRLERLSSSMTYCNILAKGNNAESTRYLLQEWVEGLVYITRFFGLTFEEAVKYGETDN